MTVPAATVLVTDGEQRAALAAVRSLGRAGYRVFVCSTRPRSLAATSRYCLGETVVPDALDAPDAFAGDVVSAVDTVGATVLLPVSEAALLALLPLRDRVRAAMPFSSLNQFRRICDKSAVLAAAGRHGIATPSQTVLRTKDDAASIDWRGRFPLVLKPARSVATDGASDGDLASANPSRFKTAVTYAVNAEAFEAQLAMIPRSAYPILVQERIDGPGFAISVLVWNGHLRAAFAHRRLREKPPSGGVSVLRESIPLDPVLLARSIELLQEFDWQGVAMVEYKLRGETREAFLMEINGRLWGSLQLAVDSGVDFPRLLVECAVGTPPDPVIVYPAGVRTRWEWGDVDHLLARLRRSPAALALPAGAPGRLRTLLEFVRSFGPGIHREVLQLDDPSPFFRESADWIRRR